MTTRLRAVGARRCRAIVPALLLGLACGVAIAADASAPGEAASIPTPPAVEDLVELDEIWVRGKSLGRLIEDAEDAFFARYNELNTNDKYDVFCGDLALSRGSMIVTRTCVPGFIADNSRSRLVSARSSFTPPLMTQQPMCYGSPTVSEGGLYFEGGCYGSVDTRDPTYYGGAGYWDTYYESFGGLPAGQTALVSSSLLELEATHRRQEYADTVLKVIQGDGQLQDMAQELARLYGDMELAQQRYQQVRKERSEARPRNYGPRARQTRN